MNKNQLFKEKVSVMLKVQFFVVCVFFILNQGFKSKLLITTCRHFLKLQFSSPKMSVFLILNWDGWVTRNEQLIDCGLSQLAIQLNVSQTQPAVSPSAHEKLLVIKQLTCKSLSFQSSFFRDFFFFFHKDQQQFQDHKSSYNLP